MSEEEDYIKRIVQNLCPNTKTTKLFENIIGDVLEKLYQIESGISIIIKERLGGFTVIYLDLGRTEYFKEGEGKTEKEINEAIMREYGPSGNWPLTTQNYLMQTGFIFYTLSNQVLDHTLVDPKSLNKMTYVILSSFSQFCFGKRNILFLEKSKDFTESPISHVSLVETSGDCKITNMDAPTIIN